MILLIAMGVGAAVSASGLIGFVGLTVPHIVRLFWGPNHRHVLPGSLLFGAILLVSADLVARTIIVPQELPIGLMTALLGAPFFLFLILKSKRGNRIRNHLCLLRGNFHSWRVAGKYLRISVFPFTPANLWLFLAGTVLARAHFSTWLLENWSRHLEALKSSASRLGDGASKIWHKGGQSCRKQRP